MRVSVEEALACGWITPKQAQQFKKTERKLDALLGVQDEKAHKFHAEATMIDCIKFPSQREANRYCELKLLERSGAIENLKMQVRYTLEEGRRLKNGRYLRKREYVSDFEYDEVNTGLHIIEDAKGYRTREYRRKIQEFMDLYVTGKENIEFREV